jgi:hypothetical protein
MAKKAKKRKVTIRGKHGKHKVARVVSSDDAARWKATLLSRKTHRDVEVERDDEDN